MTSDEFEECFARAVSSYLADRGFVIVGIETARAVEDIERANYEVPLGELEDVIYAIHAGSKYSERNYERNDVEVLAPLDVMQWLPRRVDRSVSNRANVVTRHDRTFVR